MSRFCMQWLHDLKVLSVDISNIAIITIIHNNSKSEAINLKNSVLEDRGYV